MEYGKVKTVYSPMSIDSSSHTLVSHSPTDLDLEDHEDQNEGSQNSADDYAQENCEKTSSIYPSHTTVKPKELPRIPLIVLLVVVSALGLVAMLRIHELEEGEYDGTISQRANERYMNPGIQYMDDWLAACQDRYGKDDNPQGALPLAVAENNLMQTDIMDRINGFHDYTREVTSCGVAAGQMSVRETVAKFLGNHVFHIGGTTVDPDHLVLAGGVTALLNMLSMTLFDRQDGILVPVPFYSNFVNDFRYLGDVFVVGVYGEKTKDISSVWTIHTLDAAFEEAMKQGHKPKALLITNPRNPLGTLYTDQDLRVAIEWTKNRAMHLIVDEIYALSVFEEGRQFTSVVKLLDNKLDTHVHVLWGTAKDFSVSGIRLGVLYTQNTALLQAMSNVAKPFMASSMAQQFVGSILSDDAFVRQFIQQNKARLSKSYNKLKTGLEELGVSVISADGAIFCVVDLGFLLNGVDGEGTWQNEKELQSRLVQAGIVLTPGKSFHAPIPGYFRICYAFIQTDEIDELLLRLRTIIHETTDGYRRSSFS